MKRNARKTLRKAAPRILLALLALLLGAAVLVGTPSAPAGATPVNTEITFVTPTGGTNACSWKAIYGKFGAPFAKIMLTSYDPGTSCLYGWGRLYFVRPDNTTGTVTKSNPGYDESTTNTWVGPESTSTTNRIYAAMFEVVREINQCLWHYKYYMYYNDGVLGGRLHRSAVNGQGCAPVAETPPPFQWPPPAPTYAQAPA